jgi:hypothetical protein
MSWGLGTDAPWRSRTRATPLIATILAALVAGMAAGALTDPFEANTRSGAGPIADARALARLDAHRMLLRARLSASETRQAQAAAAVELAEAYGQAAEAADSPHLVTVAHEAERAYAGLGAAGDEGSAHRFAAASDEVARAESRVAAAVARRR